jgi:subtilase family serine protease
LVSRFHPGPGSPNPGSSNTGDCVEAYLDVEWAGAVARNATVVYVYATSVYVAVSYAISQNLAPVVTYSFSSCEQNNSASSLSQFQLMAQQANAQGITWVASSGDSGAAGCDANFSAPPATHGLAVRVPASVPEVTAVGGTEFDEAGVNYWGRINSSTSASALGYIPETAWNETASSGALAASGGGLSTYFPEPAWQSALGVQSSSMRAVPDIAFTAAGHDGYWIYAVGKWGIVGGTSSGTPSFGGMIALLNQYQVANGLQTQAGQGNINPDLYGLFQNAPSAFHDITTGDNIVPCTGTRIA